MRNLVSIIIPSYNRAHCLERAIQSALQQTYTDREVLVVDDGSTDNTAEVLAPFGDAISVIHQSNAGPSAARNTGIRAARGDFVAFLDSDDEWLPGKLEYQLPLMQEADVILSASNWQSKSRDVSSTAFDSFAFGESWICDRPPEFVSRPGGHPLMLSSWLVRRDILTTLGGFDNSLRLGEDNDLLFRLAFKGRFALTRKVLLLRETGQDAVKLSNPGTLKYQRNVTRSMCRVIANARVLAFGEPKLVQRQFEMLYAYYLRREMEFAALDGKYWAARRRGLETLRHHPDMMAAMAACLGIIAPGFVRRRIRKKYRIASIG
jgi:glycosyltransferase involved in cell wall biosynthesis